MMPRLTYTPPLRSAPFKYRPSIKCSRLSLPSSLPSFLPKKSRLTSCRSDYHIKLHNSNSKLIDFVSPLQASLTLAAKLIFSSPGLSLWLSNPSQFGHLTLPTQPMKPFHHPKNTRSQCVLSSIHPSIHSAISPIIQPHSKSLEIVRSIGLSLIEYHSSF